MRNGRFFNYRRYGLRTVSLKQLFFFYLFCYTLSFYYFCNHNQ